MMLYDILCQSAEQALTLQSKNGAMPAGHNGPYQHQDTPLRATAHWAILFMKVWQITEIPRFRDAALRCCDYLISNAARPYGKGFLCTVGNPNGLIAPAWVMEALALATTTFGESKYRDTAIEVFNLYPFDFKTGLWTAINAAGSSEHIQDIFYQPKACHIHITDTYNHLLWFALAGLLLVTPTHDHILEKVDCFLDNIPNYFKVYDSGCICHRVYWEQERVQHNPAMAHKEIPYHGFSLYAYGVIRQLRPELAIFKDSRFKSALNYILDDEYYNVLLDTQYENAVSGAPANQQNLPHNRFGFPYNVTGFETAYTLHAFSDHYDFDVSDSMQQWCSEQLKRCFNHETKLLDKATEDPMVLAARIYEATRLPNLEISL
ncbi:MAG: hypothetical protein L3J71_01585 [Victivallaceae bacterium]|nr:hypothetical protein [Victivallaceae bacterium]